MFASPLHVWLFLLLLPVPRIFFCQSVSDLHRTLRVSSWKCVATTVRGLSLRLASRWEIVVLPLRCAERPGKRHKACEEEEVAFCPAEASGTSLSRKTMQISQRRSKARNATPSSYLNRSPPQLPAATGTHNLWVVHSSRSNRHP
jgi:hypothetical protein